jgi:Domain of unknown function (DUF1707)
MTTSDPWAQMTHDPRLPEHAHLRSSQRDRDAVAQVLAESFADGRLDREEFDARSDTLAASRTLGELPPIVADLAPPTPLTRPPVIKPPVIKPPGSRSPVTRSPVNPSYVFGPHGGSGSPGLPPGQLEEIRAKAVQRYQRERRDSLWTLITVSVICFTVWGATGGLGSSGFPWPLIVMAALAAYHAKVVLTRRERIEEETHRRARRALKAQERKSRRQLP